ncbi:hypothetical protein Tco_0054807, partial [Tanacetum coccineum]
PRSLNVSPAGSAHPFESPPADSEPVPTATVVNAPIVSTNTFVSTTIAQDAPFTSHSLSSSQGHPPVFPQGVAAGPTIEDTLITQDVPSISHSLSSSQVHPPVFPQGVATGPTIEDTSITQADLHPSVNPVAGEPSFAQSTSGDVSLAEPNQVSQPPDHLRKWTRKQLASDALWCRFHTELSKVEPKNFKMA